MVPLDPFSMSMPPPRSELLPEGPFALPPRMTAADREPIERRGQVGAVPPQEGIAVVVVRRQLIVAFQAARQDRLVRDGIPLREARPAADETAVDFDALCEPERDVAVAR